MKITGIRAGLAIASILAYPGKLGADTVTVDINPIETRFLISDTVPPIGRLKINKRRRLHHEHGRHPDFQRGGFLKQRKVPPAKLLLSMDRGESYVEEDFVQTKQVTLPSGGHALLNGSGVFKQIFVKFKDAVGNQSAAAQNGIVLDALGPAKGVVILKKRN